MTLRLTPERMGSYAEKRHFHDAVQALMRMGWSRKLIHFADGTQLLTDEYLERSHEYVTPPKKDFSCACRKKV